MKYANYNSNEDLLGWYDADIHNTIPTPNVEVDDSVWQNALDNGHNKITPAGVTSYVAYTPTTAELKEHSMAKSKIALDKTNIAMTPDGFARMSATEQNSMDSYRSDLFDNIAAGGSSTGYVPPVPAALHPVFIRFDI